MIIFPKYPIHIDYWYIGKPLFLKYKIFFDRDRKTIGLYKNYKDKSCDINESKGEKENVIVVEKSNNFLVFVVIILIFVIFGILYYFFRIRKSRKIRANELEENYSYIPQQK